MRETIAAGEKKDRARKTPLQPSEEVPPHPDPARQISEKTNHINGHSPKPTLQQADICRLSIGSYWPCVDGPPLASGFWMMQFAGWCSHVSGL